MNLKAFDYDLPPDRIAQSPTPRRDDARLMLVDRATGSVEHFFFRDLPDLLLPKEVLVLNDSRVFRARLFGVRRDHPETKAVEVLLLRPLQEAIWEALVRPGRKVRTGTELVFGQGSLEARILEGPPGPKKRLHFRSQGDFWDRLRELGRVPLPPYIRRPFGQADGRDAERYQTIYARVRGSVAAPTAGLHFTPELLERVPHFFLTLHVGYGTFKPITNQDTGDHRMDAEAYWLGAATAQSLTRHRASGGELIAVGTTTTRALEQVWITRGKLQESAGETTLFISPGFRFRAVDCLLTNFHLPRSTLLVLVSAFAGREFILDCYRQAIENGYRFYSYGDAMLIR